jgi:hypothetical protein
VGEDGQEQGSMGVAAGDYLHTGWPAIFVSNFADEYNTLYRHDSALMYSDVSLASKIAQGTLPYVGWGAAFFDYDNDGWLDLMVVNGHVYPQVANAKLGASYEQRVLLYRNLRDGTFEEVGTRSGAALKVPHVSRGAAFGDIDNDGDIDVVINNLDGKPTILRNDGGNRNNWITLKLLGNGRNRSSVGARVKVTSGELVQSAEVETGGSYLSTNDLPQHFGLEKQAAVDSIEIRWPGGNTETIRKIRANQFVTVKEGKGIVKLTPAASQNLH